MNKNFFSHILRMFPMRYSCLALLVLVLSPCVNFAAQQLTYDAAGELVSVQVVPGNTAPTIVVHPVSAIVEIGRAHGLSVIAAGPGTLGYQWRKDGSVIPGATSATLLFSSLSAGDVGSYTATVTNQFGSVTSNPAVISLPVNPFAAAVGTNIADWTFGGSSAWVVITGTNNTRDGLAVGTAYNYMDDSFFEGTVILTNMVTLKFWVKHDFDVYSQTANFAFSVNGHEKISRGGLYSWTEFAIHLPPGTHTLRWFNRTSLGSIALDGIRLNPAPDTDGDGMSDEFEIEYFDNLAYGPTEDPDNDENNNLVEYYDITQPDYSLSLFLHLYLATNGAGQVSSNPPEPRTGYSSPTTVNIAATTVPGNTFVGWSGAVSNSFTNASVYFSSTYYFAGSSMWVTGNFSPIITLPEAIDSTGLTWTTGGERPFIGQTVRTYDGSDALYNGPMIVTNGTVRSWIEAPVQGPRTIRFRAAGQHGPTYRFPGFESTVDGDETFATSLGNFGSWHECYIHVPPGAHTVQIKLSQTNTTYDAWTVAYLDDFVVSTPADSDFDGLSDDWEMMYFGNLFRDGSGDKDNDGVTDGTEYLENSHPDSDGSLRVRLTTGVTGNGSVQISPAKEYYAYGETVTFTAVPTSGWALESWDGLTNFWEGSRSATNVSWISQVYRATHVVANFVPVGNIGGALDETSLAWSSTFPRWVVTTNVSHDGVDSMQTPPLMPYSPTNSRMSATVVGPKILSFWWKANMRKSLGSLEFEGAGQTFSIDGFRDWERRFVQIPPGTALLQWNFINGADDGLGSTGWVDRVMISDDSDQDGLPDSWEVAQFGSLAATGSADPDGDNVNNQNEWADGTNPKSNTSVVYRLSVLREQEDTVGISPYALGYTNGAHVVLTADAAFTGWSGDADGSANPLHLTMNSSKQISAAIQPLALGVDNSDLVFSSGGVAPWTRQIRPRQQFETNPLDDDWVRNPTGLLSGEESWMEVTLSGPGKLDFMAFPQFYGGGHLRWELDGVEVERLPYLYYSPVRYTINLLEGQHTVRWVCRQGNNPNDVSFLDNIRWVQYESLPLATALDNPNLIWTTANAAPWRGQSEFSHDGVDAAVSPDLGEYQSTYLETTVTNDTATVLSFWWKNATDSYWDELEFLLDGLSVESVPKVNGYRNWSLVTVQLAPGVHTLKWVFSHDYGVNSTNRAYLDQVLIQPIITTTLAQALDTTDLTWTTSTTGAWTGRNLMTHDGVDAAASGNIAAGQTNWIRTQVTGPGTLSFWWKVSGETWDGMFFYLNNSQYGAVSPIIGQTDWRKVTVSLPGGTHTVGWHYIKDDFSGSGAANGWVDEVTWTPLVTVNLPEALDTPGRVWTTGGNTAWFGLTSGSHDGVDVATSGSMGNSAQTYLESTFAGPGVLSYWWKVSSETNFDYLRLYMNGAPVPSVSGISGEVDWTNITVDVPSGNHIFRWNYAKDSSQADGEDKAWVDQVFYTRTGTNEPPARFRLTLKLSPTNSGSFYATPYSADGFYDSNTLVTVQAYGASGKGFAGWTGAMTTKTNPLTIRMNTNKVLTATFTNLPPSYLLTTKVSPANAGYITTIPYQADNRFLSNTTVKVTATPNPGFKFVRWTGASVSTNSQTTVVMKGAKSVQAIFTNLPLYKLTTSVIPAGAGTISATPYSADNTYYAGTVVTLAAIPGETNSFSTWIGTTGLSNVTRITMTSNKSVSALFDNPGQFVFQNTNGQLALWFMNSTQRVASVVSPIKPTTGWRVSGTGDFDANGFPDLLFSSGNTKAAAWILSGNVSTKSVFLRGGLSMTGYRLVGSSHFDTNGVSDLLWQNSTGILRTWMMNSITNGVTGAITNTVPVGWNAVAMADFNDDGASDILLQHTTGKLIVWSMNGLKRVSTLQVNGGVAPAAGWLVRGITDLNGDTEGDIIFQRTSDGKIMVWFMNGTARTSAAVLPVAMPPSWTLRATK